MIARARAAEVVGLEAAPVVVEVHRGPGLPQLVLVGLARGAAKEAVVRVRAALLSVGVSLGTSKLVANMLPADLPKEASALDLALALALMVAAGHLPPEALAGRRFFGALSLGGDLEPVGGAVLAAALSRTARDDELLLSGASLAQAAVIPGVSVRGAATLADVVAHLRGERALPTAAPAAAPPPVEVGCLSEVRGQTLARRALEVAAAGGHHMLMVGPPGAGKSFLARRLPGILPPLSVDERIEVTRILAATRDPRALAIHRPFRAPHHGASAQALCGGGARPRPGEITLAHRGVLFLDELAEFSRASLESLREPLEEGSVRISRARMALDFPARAQLVAAMNPCPCGHLRPRELAATGPSACVCSMAQIERYRARISGPLLDRIDVRTWLEPPTYAALAATEAGALPSRVVADRVRRARARQVTRLGEGTLNAHLSWGQVRGRIAPSAAVDRLLERACRPPSGSARGLGRVARLAATLADLEGMELAGAQQVAEALRLSGTDGAGW